MALCVTGPGMEKEKLLGDVPLPTGSGRNMATASADLLHEWRIAERVIAMCFDTTSSMTGPKSGKENE